MNPSLLASALPARHPVRPLAPQTAFRLSLAFVAVWALWAVYFNTAQFGDNVEQFNWAQSLELGYRKHPPLPSWALGGLIRCFGPSVLWAYALATACLLGTACFTWAIAKRLVGDRAAGAAMLLWGLSLSFSQRVQLYNHNTVLVLFIAATVWTAMRAADAERRPLAWWLATGIFAAGAVLSKYQALVPLAGMVAALALSGRLQPPVQKRGLALGIATMLLVCAPHFSWVVRHDFSTLRYASEAVEPANLAKRLLFVVSFVANQVRLESPALLAILLCLGWARFGRRVDLPAISDRAAPTVWMFGLIGSSLLALAAMALLAGVSLRNHWGVQTLQFVSLWLAYRWDRRQPIDLRALAGAAFLVHGIGLAHYAFEHSDADAVLDTRRIDTMYPARRLAQASVAHWTETTSCAMHYVAGSVFDSGLVSLYSGGNLAVFDTASATPWVHLEDLRREGALYILEGDAPEPEGVTHVVSFDLVPGDHAGRPVRTVRIGILMPEKPCDD